MSNNPSQALRLRLHQLDTLFGVLSEVHTHSSRMLEEMTRLEAIATDGELPEEWHQSHWDDLTGIPEADAEDERLLVELENTHWGGVVADVIRQVRRFRSKVDAALDILGVNGGAMDGKELTPQSWSVLVEGDLRKLRGCILRNQPRDFFPSCLPWVGQGVVESLSTHHAQIYTRMQEVNSMRNVLRKRAAAEPSKPSHAARSNPRKPAALAVLDIVREAEAQHEAKLREDQQKLLADPMFMMVVKGGEHREKALTAVAEAQAPLKAELDALIAEHPVYPLESEISKRIKALIWAIQETQRRVLAEHGITLRKACTSPTELLDTLRTYKWTWWTTLTEITNRPSPMDTLWSDAQSIWDRNPSLPPLPEKPDDGRQRFVAIFRWCEGCLGLAPGVIEAFDHASPTPQASGSTQPTHEPTSPPHVGVILRDRHQGPIVCGVEKPLLTKTQYDVIFRLVQAGSKGLSGARLGKVSGHSDAVQVMVRLIGKDADWKRALPLPGKPGGGYRVVGGQFEDADGQGA